MARHRRSDPELAIPHRYRHDIAACDVHVLSDIPGQVGAGDADAPTTVLPMLELDARLSTEPGPVRPFGRTGTASAAQDTPAEDTATVAASRTRRAGAHRRTNTGAGGRVLAVSAAAGALFAAATSSAHAASAHPQAAEGAAVAPQVATPPELLAQAPQVLQVAQVPTLADFADQLERARVREDRRLAQEAEARRPRTLMPVSGTLTSNFGPRWGTTHYGLDIANVIGTPIVSVTDGTVLEAGPASGFGLWVRILQDDGTIGVFGHIDQALVSAGQRVRAGEQVATVGNRGQSTGPHLHYEVWEQDGRKADPVAWLNARGVQVAPDARA